MTDTLEDRSEAAFETRRRREERADATVEVTFDERTAYTCPECGESSVIGIHGRPYDEPSFLSCSSWDCDAFLKFVDDDLLSGNLPPRGANELIARDGKIYRSFGPDPLAAPAFEVVGETEHQADFTEFAGGSA